MPACASASEPYDLLRKQQELKLRLARLELIKSDGLAFYKPFEKQDMFHQAGLTSRRRMVRSGNRFGKSTMGCAEDSAWLRGERMWYAKDSPYRTGGIPQRPVKGLVITTDWDKVDEIWTSQRGDKGKLWRFLPASGFVKSTRRNHSGAIDMVECANRSVLRFDTVKSWMANPMGSESSDWDFIHIDEPCPQKMWTAVSRGLIDRNGAAWFTLTPLSEFWINDYFFPEDTGGKPRVGVWAVDGSTYDNIYLSRESVEEFESTLTEDEVQCRIHGLPLHLAGLIYKEFNWDEHVLSTVPSGWKSMMEPPRNWPVYIYIDPHPQTPHAVLFITVTPRGFKIVFKDLFVHNTITELCELIHKVIDGRRVVRVRIDPYAFINDPMTASNMAEDFARHGVYCEKAVKDLDRGIIAVKEELRQKKLLFSPSATRSLWEIQRYAWSEKDNRPMDVDDHAMECLYRMVLDDPRWVDFAVVDKPTEEEQFGELNLKLQDLEEVI